MIWIVFLAVAAQSAELPEVTVKAKRPSSADRVRRIDLSESGTNGGIEAAIGSDPSLVTHRRGENDGELPQIRGEASQDSRWLLESVPLLYDGSSGRVAVPPEALSSLDIYYLGVPARFLTDGLGSAVNLRLREPLVESFGAGLRYGSFGSRRVAAEGATLGASVHLNYHEGEDNYPYLDTNGTLFNEADDRTRSREFARFRRLTVLPQFQRATVFGQLRGFGLFNHGTSEIPGSITSIDGGSLVETSALMSSQLVDNRERWRGGLFGAYDSSHYLPGGSARTTPLEIQSTRVGLGMVGGGDSGELSVRPVWEGLALRGGLGTGTHSMVKLPVAVSKNVSSGPVVISPSLFFLRTEYPEAKLHYDSFSPRLQTRWNRPFGTSNSFVHFNLGHYFRHPGLGELHGQPRILAANPGLRPERSFKGELVFSEILSRSLSYELSHFQSLATDRIVMVENAQGVMSNQNVGRSLIAGESVAVKIESGPFSVDFGGTYLHTQNLSEISYLSGNRLPFRPSIAAKVGAIWTRNRWRIGLTHSYFGAMAMDLANRQEQMATHSLDFRTVYSSRTFGEWGLEAINLLDSTLATHRMGDYVFDSVPSGIPGYPSPGRRFYLSWRISI